MDRALAQRDLEYYGTKFDFGMMFFGQLTYAINWLRFGDVARADAVFSLGFVHQVGAWKVWREHAPSATAPAGGGCVNFLTGAGAFLQAFLFGYLGLNSRSDGIEINPTLPTGASNATASVEVAGTFLFEHMSACRCMKLLSVTHSPIERFCLCQSRTCARPKTDSLAHLHTSRTHSLEISLAPALAFSVVGCSADVYFDSARMRVGGSSAGCLVFVDAATNVSRPVPGPGSPPLDLPRCRGRLVRATNAGPI